MLNFNGEILAKSKFSLAHNNRGFSYGDAIFDTSKFIDGKIQFSEDHYFRLMASMRILRMQIPLTFTLTYFEKEIHKTLVSNNLSEARIKFSIFRNTGGFYTPKVSTISFLIETTELTIDYKQTQTLEVFKDYRINPDLLSSIKTNNRIINVLSSIYAKENDLDNCVLLNNNNNIVETNNANIFLISKNIISTPPISDGCIKGVMRKNVIASILQKCDFILEEKSISPFALQKADSVFVTNSIIGIQTITNYKKKKYNSYLVNMVKEGFSKFKN